MTTKPGAIITGEVDATVWDLAPESGTYWATVEQAAPGVMARLDKQGFVREWCDVQDVIRRANAFTADPRVRVQRASSWAAMAGFVLVYHHVNDCRCPNRRRWRVERRPWLVDVLTRRIPSHGFRELRDWKTAPCLFGGEE